MLKHVLFSPDPPEGGNGQPNPPTPPSNPDPPLPAAPPAPAPPPAANVVLNGDRSERELQLQEDLRKANERADKAEGTVKDRETKVAELEDQLSELTSSPAPAAPRKKPFRLRRIKV